MSERLGRHVAPRLSLDAVVSDGRRRREPGLHVARLEQLPLPGEMAPDAGEAVGLELELHEVVLRPAQVFVGGEERERRRDGRQPEPVQTMFEDRVDMPVGARADGDGAGAGGLEAGGAVAFGETQDAEARAVALLGVRPIGEDGGDEGGGLRADRAGPGDEARRGPLQMG